MDGWKTIVSFFHDGTSVAMLDSGSVFAFIFYFYFLGGVDILLIEDILRSPVDEGSISHVYPVIYQVF